MSSFPEFDDHLSKVQQKYGHLFKDKEQLTYFAMLPFSDKTRDQLIQKMIKQKDEENAEDDIVESIDDDNKTNL